jgi:K+-transporting ATPase KdpF subunit
MSINDIVALIISVIVLIYLVYAMLYPENV